MAREKLHKKIVFVLLSISINLLVLLMIFQLSRNRAPRSNKISFNAISLTKYESNEKPAQTHPEKKRPAEEKKSHEIKKYRLKKKRVKFKRPEMKLKIPEFEIEVDRGLLTDMPVLLPPEPLNIDTSPVKNAVVAKNEAHPKSRPAEYKVGEVDRTPEIVQKIEPIYPRRARRRGISGEVEVKFLVSSNGSVMNLSIIKAEPKGVFEKSVIEAVSKWRFYPGIYKGDPVPTWMILPIRFNLEG